MTATPEKITIESLTYGNYTATLIGTISYPWARQSGMTEDDILEWSQKHLPRRFFMGHPIIIKHPDSDPEGKLDGPRQIFVPLQSDNPKLPVAIDDKKVEIWKKNSQKVLLPSQSQTLSQNKTDGNANMNAGYDKTMFTNYKTASELKAKKQSKGQGIK